MSNLQLPLKRIYFEQIRSGEKTEEFRLQTPYWTKRLVDRDYENVILTLGYPSRDDQSRRLIRPWRGFIARTITHPHFGPDPVSVYAIKVN